MTHPQTPDYIAELVTIDLSKRIRWIMALVLAGEIDETQAEKLREPAGTHEGGRIDGKR